jgi:protein arginine kinase
MVKHSVLPRSSGWFSLGGTDYDVVISTSAGLARNLDDIPFGHLLSPDDRVALRRRVEQIISGQSDEFLCVDGEALRPEVSRFYETRGTLGDHESVAVSFVTDDERLQVHLGGEDHLLLSAVSGGWDPEDCLERVRALDQALEEALPFAVSLRLGYLSPNIESTGTGLTAAAVLFLPALHQSDGVEEANPAPERVTIRPLFADDLRQGALFELSCTARFSEPEEENLRLLADSLKRLVHYEREARRRLVDEHRGEMEDAVHRSLGTLKHARSMSCSEAVHHAVVVRLGRSCGLLEEPELSTATELLFAVADSSVAVLTPDGEQDAGVRRAALVRRLLQEEKTG